MLKLPDWSKPGEKFRIVPKRDFGSGPGYFIDGLYVKTGFVVTHGGCNVMPGATWFLTIPEAYEGIRRFLAADTVAEFWKLYRADRSVS